MLGVRDSWSPAAAGERTNHTELLRHHPLHAILAHLRRLPRFAVFPLFKQRMVRRSQERHAACSRLFEASGTGMTQTTSLRHRDGRRSDCANGGVIAGSALRLYFPVKSEISADHGRGLEQLHRLRKCAMPVCKGRQRGTVARVGGRIARAVG